MKIKKGAVLVLVLCMSLLFSACSSKPEPPVPPEDHSISQVTEPEEPVEQAPESNVPLPSSSETPDLSEPVPPEPEEPEAQTVQSIFEPEPQELEALTNTWIYIEEYEDGLTVYRLMLMENGEAQMPVQDEILQLLGLYGGTWSMVDHEHIQLSLTADETLSSGISSERLSLSGTYVFHMNTDKSLTLTSIDTASDLIDGQAGDSVTYHTPEYWHEVNEETSRQRLCDAVLNYYESLSGQTYPGVAELDSVDEAGYHIHLYEDMGDHIVTSGWYLIDPGTYLGYDEMTDEEIDFYPYADHGFTVPPVLS